MDIRALRYFVEVIQRQGFTAAAQALFVTQPTVSKMIRQLEDELGTPVLLKQGRRIEPTDAGRIVLQRGREILALHTQLRSELTELVQVSRGELVLGIPPLASYLLAPLLAQFHHDYPQVELRLFERGSNTVEDELRAGKLEIGGMLLPVDTKEYDALPICNYPLRLIVHADSPLASRASVRLEELAGESFIFYGEDFGLNDVVHAACAQAGFAPLVAGRSSQWDFIASMVAAGVGVALLPSLFSRQLDRRLCTAVPLAGPQIWWNTALVWRRGRYLSFAARAWLDLARRLLPVDAAAQEASLMLADIFCRVVDNYGDIGVCWRLARQLAAEHGWRVRLWVDDLATLARLAPGLDPRAASQRLGELDVVHWTRPAPDLPPGDAVVEAFACDPPPAFVQRMGDALIPPVWINLEYLSAESWVESCHALPSPQPNGLRKFFFFPGFTARTGGLLREAGLLAERDALQGDPGARAAFLAPLGLARQSEGERLVTLFCYPDAPATQLAQALAAGALPSTLALPPGIAPYLEAGQRGGLRIVRIPFLPQPDYDRLLWCADLNFVRGEDSFVRAQWAARPMVWHIYPQEEAAHLDKLEAWLARYPAAPAVRELQRAWNGGASPLPAPLSACLAPAAFEDWRAAARAWSGTLATQRDLAGNLADFCYNLRLSR